MSRLQSACVACWLCGTMLLASGCGQSKPVATVPPATAPATQGNESTEQPKANDDLSDGQATQQPSPQPTLDEPPLVSPSKPSSAEATRAADASVDAPPASEPQTSPANAPENAKPAPPPPEVEGLTKLDPKYPVWIDPKQKRVLVTGQVVRQQGQLEMFACLKNTKEHESVVAVDTKAYIVNAALIALGANPGGPVEFRPEFKPARGPEIEVTVLYTDQDGKRREARGQEWIRNIKTGKELDQPWVFAGSGFWKDDSTGQQHFMAEDGDFICISNFTSAMLDLPVESSQASADLLFEAFTERIPPVKTDVVLVLKPKLGTTKEPTSEQPAKDDNAKADSDGSK